mmetsp:Transcript_20983/g.66840  ORF Transcript_20983/g.66840 Transcript_20983/m.66840 type:complete len:364 (-) Transcript_20983:258-1349(-)
MCDVEASSCSSDLDVRLFLHVTHSAGRSMGGCFLYIIDELDKRHVGKKLACFLRALPRKAGNDPLAPLGILTGKVNALRHDLAVSQPPEHADEHGAHALAAGREADALSNRIGVGIRGEHSEVCGCGPRRGDEVEHGHTGPGAVRKACNAPFHVHQPDPKLVRLGLNRVVAGVGREDVSLAEGGVVIDLHVDVEAGKVLVTGISVVGHLGERASFHQERVGADKGVVKAGDEARGSSDVFILDLERVNDLSDVLVSEPFQDPDRHAHDIAGVFESVRKVHLGFWGCEDGGAAPLGVDGDDERFDLGHHGLLADQHRVDDRDRAAADAGEGAEEAVGSARGPVAGVGQAGLFLFCFRLRVMGGS